MDTGATVRYVNNNGQLSDDICELVEKKKDHYRIKIISTGQILRIYHDRVKEFEGDEVSKKQFDPFDGISDNHEVWIKYNSFNDLVVCRTYAIIDPSSDHYQSVNVYDGKAPKIMEYPMKSYELLINKLKKRCYELVENNDAH